MVVAIGLLVIKGKVSFIGLLVIRVFGRVGRLSGFKDVETV